ncbi:hypothetical protein [Hymenobacter properus]|uniref:Uncharacterized protein n=1 Tax=Hymenobacter properus TaxID=2791026 RepID=A0A931BEI2_9BACT|nr:hypothetical protein [Hymenobacter properus]MBF9140822.1 hypothetical protein [Hymenobacter properus]MBR7719631.1 hypothetical protein [Microvirga sp. SRT04]
MNLIFHDRTTIAPEPGAAVLTIERKGNFYFSAGAVRRLDLVVNGLAMPVQDADNNQWYMLLGSGPAMVKHKPFPLRAVGGKSGSRLVFSSTTRARAYFEANHVPDSVHAVHLRIETQPFEQDFVGKLYPLLPVGKPSPAVAIAKAVAAVGLSKAEQLPTDAETEQILERIRATVKTLWSGFHVRTAQAIDITRALGLLSKNEALLPSVKGAPELYAALKGDRSNG